MTRARPYAFLSAFLGCIFCIFTVGIPVVLASCPMMSLPAHERSCCPASDEGAQPVLRAYQNTSCCTPKFVATRSTQEYLQTDPNLPGDGIAQIAPVALALVEPVPVIVLANAIRGGTESPPSHRPLIPIFNSSLLI